MEFSEKMQYCLSIVIKPTTFNGFAAISAKRLYSGSGS